jgi:hypothetical protein
MKRNRKDIGHTAGAWCDCRAEAKASAIGNRVANKRLLRHRAAKEMRDEGFEPAETLLCISTYCRRLTGI